MGTNHSHNSHSHIGGHGHSDAMASGNQRRLLLTLVIAATYMVAEFIGGLLTGSLALLADSGHMLSDVAALGLGIFAIRMSRRSATPERTYGFHRTEILVALVNGVTLILIAAFIVKEAWERFAAPPEVFGSAMMFIAIGGLAANVFGLWILHDGRSHSLNVRGAYLHVMADALGSMGAIVAGAAIWFLGWNWADPAISVLISLLVAWSAWGLLRQSVAVLMEGAPSGIDVDEVRRGLLEVKDVIGLHDLHVWSISSGLDSLSVHLIVPGSLDCAQRDAVLLDARQLVFTRFGIDHVTIQVEPPGFEESSFAEHHN